MGRSTERAIRAQKHRDFRTAIRRGSLWLTSPVILPRNHSCAPTRQIANPVAAGVYSEIYSALCFRLIWQWKPLNVVSDAFQSGRRCELTRLRIPTRRRLTSGAKLEQTCRVRIANYPRHTEQNEAIVAYSPAARGFRMRSPFQKPMIRIITIDR